MSDTTPRDQLAALLADDWNPNRDPILTAMFRDYAQTILDAGWRPPARTVTKWCTCDGYQPPEKEGE